MWPPSTVHSCINMYEHTHGAMDDASFHKQGTHLIKAWNTSVVPPRY